MKTIKIFLLMITFASLAALTACDKAKEKVKVEVNFDLNLPGATLYVDTFSTFGNINLGTSVIESNLQKTLDDNNANIDDIESITLKRVEIEMVNPAGQNFNLANKVYALLSASGLAETQVAYIDPVPANVTQLTLNADGANLADYLKKPQISFKLTATTNAPNLVRDTLSAKLYFNVKANVAPLD
jgi:hypothetical protein